MLSFVTERLTSTDYYLQTTLDSPELAVEESKAFELGQLVGERLGVSQRLLLLRWTRERR